MATTWGFQRLFHLLVGVAIVVVYAVTLGGLRGAVLAKGLVAAAVVWLTNACVVLPLSGQGFPGHRVLTPLGMSVFAVAHTAFFVSSCLLRTATSHRFELNARLNERNPSTYFSGGEIGYTD